MQSTVLANFSTGCILYIRLCKGFAQTVMGDYEAHPHTLHIATSKVGSPIPIPQPSAILSERLNPFFGPSSSSFFLAPASEVCVAFGVVAVDLVVVPIVLVLVVLVPVVLVPVMLVLIVLVLVIVVQVVLVPVVLVLISSSSTQPRRTPRPEHTPALPCNIPCHSILFQPSTTSPHQDSRSRSYLRGLLAHRTLINPSD